MNLEQHINARIQVLEDCGDKDIIPRLEELHRILDLIKVEGDHGAKYQTGDHVYIRKCGKTKTVVSSKADGHPRDRLYVLRDKDGSLDYGWREYELRCVRRNRV